MFFTFQKRDRENGAALFKDPEFETCLNNSGLIGKYTADQRSK